MLQMLRVGPPKTAFCCGNFSPGVMTPLASQDQAMNISPQNCLDYFENKDTSSCHLLKILLKVCKGIGSAFSDLWIMKVKDEARGVRVN